MPTLLSGVGFGICHRLLVQLSSPHPSDARPYFKIEHLAGGGDAEKHGILDEYEFDCDAGATIVMACRDLRRAQDARTRLYGLLDEHVATMLPGTKEYVYATTFRKNVKLELETLDLSSVKSVLDFGRRASDK